MLCGCSATSFQGIESVHYATRRDDEGLALRHRCEPHSQPFEAQPAGLGTTQGTTWGTRRQNTLSSRLRLIGGGKHWGVVFRLQVDRRARSPPRHGDIAHTVDDVRHGHTEHLHGELLQGLDVGV